MVQNIRYAYKQAPWRAQLRTAAWILTILVIFVIIAVAYLNISAKTYAAGISIQILRREKETLTHAVADLRDQLSSLTSFQVMSQKAYAGGYHTINDPFRIVYLPVPGYVEPELDIEVPQKAIDLNSPFITPNYTQSLWDLFMEGALKLGTGS